jgi:2-polyprenyl-6-methoxyphenol hydroxylase-like FAD-dependent oxidoreductase
MAAVLPGLESWDPLLVEAIKNTPTDTIVRWKLCLRNPQPKWTSAGGRIVQVGDAAHSLLPTSANGAAMALEDSISLAECLRLGGKEGAAVATKMHQVLRCVISWLSPRGLVLTFLQISTNRPHSTLWICQPP